jgi:Xaa-Pro aminopeptidase
VFDAMEAEGLDVLVLGRVANIRYVSGVPVLWNAGTRPFGPGAVVVREGEQVHLMSTWDEAVPEEIPRDHLYGITWNPMNYVKVVAEAGRGARRVGTDALSPLFAQLLPGAFPGAEIVDADALLRRTRRRKAAEEVDAIRHAVAVAAAALMATVARLAPGQIPRHLAGTFMGAMASLGVTTPSTQQVLRRSGDRNGETPLEPGELVTVDAGVVAGGYCGELARTWPVSPTVDRGPTADLVARSNRLTDALVGACWPGSPTQALLDVYAELGEPLPPGPVARGLGLGFDDPVITPDLPHTVVSERIETGMTLVVVSMVEHPEVGSIVTCEPVLVTPDGPERLTDAPTWGCDRKGAAA